jgi:hypothetical protein
LQIVPLAKLRKLRELHNTLIYLTTPVAAG